MDMILGILFILAKGSWPFALPQLLTYSLTDGNEHVNELYLLSCHNNPVDTLPLDDVVTFDPVMTGRKVSNSFSGDSLRFTVPGPAARL